jgi:TolB-like protein/Tfp pilus assembly protein PilF
VAVVTLFNELKRRNVFRVALGYVVIAWVLMQVGEIFAPALRLPEWVISALAFFLILGFPVALFLAWAYELTPEGLRPDQDIEPTSSQRKVNARKMDRVIIVGLISAVGFLIVDRFWPIAEPPAVGSPDQAVPIVPVLGETSIAVLPFVNMSSDREQEYFSDGLSEELLNLLSRIPELQVTSRSSAFAFKGKDINIPQVASALGVAHILEGSVRRSGDRVRITAQLIDAKRDVHLWSETYDRTLDDIFAIQDEISAAVVESLRLTLLGDTPKARELGPGALDENLQASFYWQRRAPGDVQRAREHFERSLEIDPHNAPAWAGLSVVYQELGRSGEMPLAEADRLFMESALKAVEADPDYAEGHIRLAWALWGSGDRPGAAREREIANRLDPESLLVIFDRANQLRFSGRLAESLPLYERLVERDPLSAISLNNLSTFYLESGRLEDAEAMAVRALRVNPGMSHPTFVLLEIRILQGRTREAREILAPMTAMNRLHSYMAIILYSEGKVQESDLALANIGPEAGPYPPEAFILRVRAWRGELDAAFRIMEQGLAAGTWYTNFLYDPFLANMHEDPRWMELLSAAGYEVVQ